MVFGNPPSCPHTAQAVFAPPALERFPGANSPAIRPWHQDSAFSIANYELRAKLRKISTCVKLTRNSRRINTYKLLNLTSFRMNTYTKIEGGGGVIVKLRPSIPVNENWDDSTLDLLAKPIDKAPPRAIKACQESAPGVGTGPKPLPGAGVHYSYVRAG